MEEIFSLSKDEKDEIDMKLVELIKLYSFNSPQYTKLIIPGRKMNIQPRILLDEEDEEKVNENINDYQISLWVSMFLGASVIAVIMTLLYMVYFSIF